jgi:hypothetical protein
MTTAPYNPLVGVTCLQEAGMERKHAEAVVTEISKASSAHVTKEDLDAALALQSEKLLNKIFGAVFGSAGVIVIAQMIMTAIGGK